MSNAPQILIMTANPSVARLAEVLWNEGLGAHVVDTVADARRFLDMESDSVAILDTELPRQRAFELFELLVGPRPVPSLFLVNDAEYWPAVLETYRPLQHEYGPAPIRVLEELVYRVKALLLHAGYDLFSHSSEAIEMAGATPPADSDTPIRGEIVVVFSVKGGVGKTTIAANVAVGLAQRGQRTMVVDADLRFGDIRVLLNVPPHQPLSDAWARAYSNPSAINRGVQEHPTGLKVLARPPDPILMDQLDPATISRVVFSLKRSYDFLIVDTHSALDEANLQLLDMADRIVLVTTSDVSALSNTANFVGLARQMGYFPKMDLVINRSDSGISMLTAESELGMTVMATVPSAGKWVVESANRGETLIELDPKSARDITQSLWRIVAVISGASPRDLGSRGPRGKLRAAKSLVRLPSR